MGYHERGYSSVKGLYQINIISPKCTGKIDVSFALPLRPGMYELTIISGENGLYKKETMTTVLKV